MPWQAGVVVEEEEEASSFVIVRSIKENCDGENRSKTQLFSLRLPTSTSLRGRRNHDAAPAGDAPGDPNGTADASDMPPSASSEGGSSALGEAACGFDAGEDDAAIEEPAVFFALEAGLFGRSCLFRPCVRV